MPPHSRLLRLTAEAQREVDDAAGWYEARIAGLGFEFLRAFDAVCATIGRHPLGFRVVHRQTRRAGTASLSEGLSMIERARVIHSDPQILSGTPVFVGTRVPAQTLFDYLAGGETIDEFLRQFPSVTREQAVAVLDLARDSLLARHLNAARTP